MKTALIVDANYLRMVMRLFYHPASFIPANLNHLALMVGVKQTVDLSYLVIAVLPSEEETLRKQSKQLSQSGWQVKSLVWASEAISETKAHEESALLGYIIGQSIGAGRLVVVSGADDLIPVMQLVQKESPAEVTLIADSRKLPMGLAATASRIWLLDNPTRQAAAAIFDTGNVTRSGVWDEITNRVEVST